MPIRSSAAPPEVTAKVVDDLGALGRTRGDNPSLDDAGGGLDFPVVSIPVYGISRDELGRGKHAALASAKQIGWRYVVKDSDGAGIVDHFGNHGKGNSRLMRGPSVGRYGRAGQKAEQEAPEDVAFEPRVLDFGVLGQSELWLHSPDAEDRFYSLGTAEPVCRDTKAVLAEAMDRFARQCSVESEDNGDEHDDRGG